MGRKRKSTAKRNPLDAPKINWDRQVAFAQKVRDRNTAKIEAGVTFAGQKRTGPERAPGKTA